MNILVAEPLPPPVHALPLARLALCLDCEACFEVGPGPCPACGSATWTPLARFFDRRAR